MGRISKPCRNIQGAQYSKSAFMPKPKLKWQGGDGCGADSRTWLDAGTSGCEAALTKKDSARA